MIDKNKTYKTRDGREVRIYATDGPDGAPIHGAIKMDNNKWGLNAWLENGDFVGPRCLHGVDLIEVKPRIKRKVTLAIWPEAPGVETVTTYCAAQHIPGMRPIAIIKVEIDCEEGEGLND